MVHPGIQIKAIESNTLFANPDFNEIRAHLDVEAVPVHPQIEGRVPEADKPWCDGVITGCEFTHVCPKSWERTCLVNIRWKTSVVSQGVPGLGEFRWCGLYSGIFMAYSA